MVLEAVLFYVPADQLDQLHSVAAIHSNAELLQGLLDVLQALIDEASNRSCTLTVLDNK